MGRPSHFDQTSDSYREPMVEEYIHERVAMGEFAPATAEVVRYVLRSWTRFAGEPPWTVDQVVEWVDRPSSPNSRVSGSKSGEAA